MFRSEGGRVDVLNFNRTIGFTQTELYQIIMNKRRSRPIDVQQVNVNRQLNMRGDD